MVLTNPQAFEIPAEVVGCRLYLQIVDKHAQTSPYNFVYLIQKIKVFYQAVVLSRVWARGLEPRPLIPASFWFKMESFSEDIGSVAKILTSLLNSSPGNVTETNFVTSDSQHEYLIWAIPPKTYHPLRRIVGKRPSGFFIVGKSLRDCEDTQRSPNQTSSKLKRYKNERVPVGTPLSQEVFYLTNSEPLQSYAGVSKEDGPNSKGCLSEWLLSQENIFPCSLESARYFQSVYANALRGDLQPLEMWVYVDGKNPQGITYLGMVPQENCVHSKTKDIEIVRRNSMRHVIYTSRNVPIVAKEDLPELSFFLRHHLSSSSSTAFVETHGYALHEVMGASSSNNQECKNSMIAVELTWSGVNSLLQPHPHSCDGVLHIKSIPGSVHLATHSLFLELVQVDKLSKVLENEDLPWPVPTTAAANPVASQMDAFIAKLNSSNVFSPTVQEDEDEGAEERTFAEASMAHLTFQEFARKDLDFTERLWLLLKDCVDEDDLIATLQMCNVALFSGRCQPVVHSSNMTSLAVFIRDLLQFETKEQQEKLQNRAKQFLSPDLAIKCLIEIGCEKLARDYTQFFIHQELATMGQLATYLNNNVPIHTRVSNIKKLHQTLELVVTAKSVTRLGHENLRALTQSALTYYQSHADSQQPVFSLSLPAFGSTSGAAVKSICASSNPAVWCVAIKSKTKIGSHTTIVQLSTNWPGNVDASESPGFDVTELNDDDFDPDKDKFQYFLSCAKQVFMPIIVR